MGIRKDAVNYLAWGLLLIGGGVLILFVKLLTGFAVVYWAMGIILTLVGILYLRKKPLLGLVIGFVGIFTLLGKISRGLGTLLSIAGWIAIVGGGIFIAFGLIKVKKRV
jgi:hypothetical protein